MHTPFRRGMRHARRGLFYTCALVLVLLAIAVAVADRLLPLVQKHPDKIAAWLIERAGRPVHFDHAEAHWTNRGPVFTLTNLRIGEGSEQLAVDRAELLVAMYSGMLPDHPFTELRLRGLALTVERDAAGQWHFVGLSGPKEDEHHNPLHNLEGLGELQVADATLTVRAPDLGIAFTSPRVDVRMRVTDKRMRVGLKVEATRGNPILAVVDFDRLDNNGRLWIGGNDIDFAPWSSLLGYGGADLVAGHGRIGFWTTLKDRRIVAVQADANLHDLVFRAHMPSVAPGNPLAPPHVDMANMRLTGRWEGFAGGWRAEATQLRLQSNAASGEDVLDGLAMQRTDDMTLVAPRADLGNVLSIAMLSERIPPKLRDWLQQAAPKLRLSAVRVERTRAGIVQGSATLDDASWQPVGTIPAVQGIAGNLLFDNNAIALEFRKQPSNILWPPAFRDPMPMQFSGNLVAWRDGANWTLETSNLHTQNDDLTLDTRLAVRFDADGTRPRLDLFSTIGPAHISAAHRYWILHKMSPKTVEWLDNALKGGEILGAHAIVSGDLDDWPFLHNEGRFQIDADLADAIVHFDPEWPQADHVSGLLEFAHEGMSFHGTGAVLGIQVQQLSAEIPTFHQPILDIRAAATGSGKQMLALMRQSPLQKRYADTFNALDVQGDGQGTTLHLVLPLKHELGEHSVDGDIDFRNARLSDKRWNLAFANASGRLHYDQNGMLADAMDVQVNGDPAKFHLAIGDATGDPSMAVAAQLRGTFPPATLLQHAPTLDWLKTIITGRAAWTVDVHVPKTVAGAKAAASILDVHSDLRGAELKLPAPLAKPANKALALQVHALLPADAGDIVVKLDNLLTLRGRYGDAHPFRGLLDFGGDGSAALPAQGLTVSGHVPALDAAGWIGFAANGSNGAGGLQTVDLKTDSLALGGRHFADTRLRMTRTPDATTVRLDGDALAGNIMVPSVLAHGIRGQFDRLYWPGSSTNPNGTLLADAEADMDPANVPPLHLDVADLRFGDAKLGKLVLQTRPLAQGMRIEQFDTTAKSQNISASGEWTKQGTTTQTHLAIEFRADSLGKMLDAFGFKGVVAAGKTHALLQGGWPGSPVAFRLAVLDGTLDIDVGEGRLLEVQPGAGRVLGLVSLAELPRRLTLDFRDFFDKGFSFNTLHGQFAFANGQAHTDDLMIKGPSADIHVSGSADLVAQRYDQIIEVLPKTGGLMTAVGAIAGGPIGAAVGAVAGEVLKHSMQKMARKRYHVTGPWDDPKVEPLHGDSSDNNDSNDASDTTSKPAQS